jgi:2-polyprenyl-3-methyl-5-hydroxy-6-metoxy-1,4-benzoquinol methylase
MRPLPLNTGVVSPEAEFVRVGDHSARVVTPPQPWAWAVRFPISSEEASHAVAAVVRCRRGEIRVGIVSEDGSRYVGEEATVVAGETRMIAIPVASTNADDAWLMVRTGHTGAAAECDLLAAFVGVVPSVVLSDDEAVLAFRDPAAARESCVRRAWPKDTVARIGTQHLPLEVRPAHGPFPVPPMRTLWTDPMERVALEAAEDIISRLEAFQPSAVERHIALLGKPAMRSYLRMNVVRVVRLVELLHRRGIESGTVLEVGAWFGTFALALQRLGYDVTACDRYASYGHAFDSHIALMRDAGIRVISTSRENELGEIGALNSFDVVFAGAVVEHVPHTPRHLLETLFSVTRPRGLLALDTPNVARYWNRRALAKGQTIFQPIAEQFRSEPPWEGHHREYAADELEWMLEEIGCDDIDVEFFDYNMLQFHELAAEHLECLATIVADPTQADTLLAAGRRPQNERTNTNESADVRAAAAS